MGLPHPPGDQPRRLYALRNGRIENNIIVFKSNQWYEGGVNIGPNTTPQTFVFSGNVWYCLDNPAKSAPRLPSREQGALIGQDPLLRNPAKHDFGLMSGSPAKGKGHTAVPKTTSETKPRAHGRDDPPVRRERHTMLRPTQGCWQAAAVPRTTCRPSPRQASFSPCRSLGPARPVSARHRTRPLSLCRPRRARR